jgi:hypothetical protein
LEALQFFFPLPQAFAVPTLLQSSTSQVLRAFKRWQLDDTEDLCRQLPVHVKKLAIVFAAYRSAVKLISITSKS